MPLTAARRSLSLRFLSFMSAMPSLVRAAAGTAPLKAAYVGFDLYHISEGRKRWFVTVVYLKFKASSGVRQSSQRAPFGLPFRPTQVTK